MATGQCVDNLKKRYTPHGSSTKAHRISTFQLGSIWKFSGRPLFPSMSYKSPSDIRLYRNAGMTVSLRPWNDQGTYGKFYIRIISTFIQCC